MIVQFICDSSRTEAPRLSELSGYQELVAGNRATEEGFDCARASTFGKIVASHGARPSVFVAIALDRGDLLHELIEREPSLLSSRMSRLEKLGTPLHFAALKNRPIMDKLPGARRRCGRTARERRRSSWPIRRPARLSSRR